MTKARTGVLGAGLAVLCAAAFATSPAGAATLKGKVLFEGEAPRFRPISMTSNPICAKMHPRGVVASETVVVNKNHTLRNVIVHVKSGLTGPAPAAPKTPAKMEQKGCWYVPHVLAIQAGQPVEFVNLDDTVHNVHGTPKDNPTFNLAEIPKGIVKVDNLSKPEDGFHVKCDIHPWMEAYLGVFDNPYFSVTGNEGTFEIKDLPAGTYEVEAWQEHYGTQVQKVTVSGKGTQEITFTFKGK